MEYQIYITTNLINGKRYLGKHNGKNPKYLGSGNILKDAIKKYGKNNFKKEVILVCESDKEAYTMERFLSKQYNVVESDDWYNLKLGGEGFLSGVNHPQYNIPRTIEHRQKLSKANLGQVHPIEQNKKHSQMMKGKNNPQFGKYGKDHPACGHKKTEVGLKNISEAQKNRIRTEEERIKLSEGRRGKALGENNAMSDPLNRKKVSDSKIGRKRYYREDGSFYMAYPENPIDPRG
jgi:hypothetical protein